MGKPYPLELRERVVAYVDEGHSHRAAARHFRVSPRFVNNLIILRRETGTLEAKKQGHRGNWSKLNPFEAWVRKRLKEQPDLTLNELRIELLTKKGVSVQTSSIFYWLRRLGLSHKKNTSSR